MIVWESIGYFVEFFNWFNMLISLFIFCLNNFDCGIFLIKFICCLVYMDFLYFCK